MSADFYKTKISNCHVIAGNEIFTEIAGYFDNYSLNRTDIVILLDENTKKYCLDILKEKTDLFEHAKIIDINSGEANKTLDTASYIWDKLSDMAADRHTLMVNLGGGVICDLGAFVASVYKRGLKFINIPTTLMSQVDAGFGGKSAIDFNGIKNLLGLFSDPVFVFVYPPFLNSLNTRDFYSGFAEIIKYSVISDVIQPDDLINFDIHNKVYLNKLIFKSIGFKSSIVNLDLRENGLRKILNFGHTIGHAMESFSLINDKNYLTHGEAIAIGIICETYLSVKKSGFPESFMHLIASVILQYFPKYSIKPADFIQLLGFMKHDKKNLAGKIKFVLMKAPGIAVFDQDCNKEEIAEALNYYAGL